MKARYVILLLFLFSTVCSFSQKETYNWYFGNKTGLQYHTGVPVPVDTSAMFSHETTSVISDTAGNLMFYSNSEKVWNRNHEIMPNGDSLKGWSGRPLAVVTVPAPGKSDQYYVFHSYPYGTTNVDNTAYYSIVDMKADNGLGDVIVKNIPVPHGLDTESVLVMMMHANNEAFWLVLLKVPHYEIDTIFSYLLDEHGLNGNPVKTPTNFYRGFLKFSPNGKYLFMGGWGGGTWEQRTCIIYEFNKANGTLQEVLSFDPAPGDDEYHHIEGAEFSANGEFLYCTMWKRSFWPNMDTTTSKIIQYDMSKIGNVTEFEASAFVLDVTVRLFPQSNAYEHLQMGPDGKIVVATYGYSLGVINYPEKHGFNCGLRFDAISVYPRTSTAGLPNFVQSYFMKFSWKGNCLGDTTRFESWFLPIPDSIHWEFGDPSSGSANYSNLLNPRHKYQAFGTYTVHAIAYYPGGNTQEYTRDVLITPYPVFDLGPDKYICSGDQVTINSNAMLVEYHWSTGETSSSIMVNEPGKYWLEVENNNACKASDTISVINYAPPILIDSLIVVSPTTCGNATGAIRHLQVEGGDPPVNIQWLDQWGNVISTEPDITNLAVGKYYLTVGYGAGCHDTLADYTIVNFDSDLIIEDVVIEGNAHCNQPTGSLQVKVKDGLSDMLLYSVNGIDYYANEGHFEGLLPGSYIVMVKDSEGCEAVYVNNPVTIGNIDGPAINSIVITPETPPGNNGSIDFTASGAGSLIYYLNGIMQDTSYVEGLPAGTYLLSIEDEFGCRADTLIEIPFIEGNYLYAIADNDRKCLKAIASSQIRVSHVSGLKYLKATLSYDGSRLNCTHFNGSLDGIGAIVYPAQEMVVVEWQGLTSITSIDTIALGELIFETLQPGLADVNWQSPPGTVFTDENGNAIHPELIPGLIEVHPLPEVQLNAFNTICQGDSINLIPQIIGGTDPLSLHWETPSGLSTSPDIRIPNASPEHTGRYTLMLSDHFRCADTAEIHVNVVPPPQTNFPEEPITFENQYILEAPQGYASYEWSNGETNYFITVTEEGEYSVIIKTTEGCESKDTAMLVNVTVPLYVPNAFTPNGDGLNDTFKPIITKPELISQYHLSIYNRWGQCFFETSDPAKGWDGMDELPGVYNWVISYMDGMGKVNQIRGVVTLIK